jgi:hypothetical protein
VSPARVNAIIAASRVGHAKLRLLYLGGGLDRAAPTCICWGDGCAECPCCVATSMQRPRRARCPPMVDETLPRSPCLQRADERHTLVNALGRTSYTPNPRSPEGFRNPAQSAPESPCPGRGSCWVRAGGLPSLVQMGASLRADLLPLLLPNCLERRGTRQHQRLTASVVCGRKC